MMPSPTPTSIELAGDPALPLFFVLCGLPVRRLPKDQLLYERRHDRFVLQVTGHPEFGVPFGQARLVPIFLATLAVQQKTQTIL